MEEFSDWFNKDGLTTTLAVVVPWMELIEVEIGLLLLLGGNWSFSRRSIVIGRPNVFLTIWRMCGKANCKKNEMNEWVMANEGEIFYFSEKRIWLYDICFLKDLDYLLLMPLDHTGYNNYSSWNVIFLSLQTSLIKYASDCRNKTVSTSQILVVLLVLTHSVDVRRSEKKFNLSNTTIMQSDRRRKLYETKIPLKAPNG